MRRRTARGCAGRGWRVTLLRVTPDVPAVLTATTQVAPPLLVALVIEHQVLRPLTALVVTSNRLDEQLRGPVALGLLLAGVNSDSLFSAWWVLRNLDYIVVVLGATAIASSVGLSAVPDEQWDSGRGWEFAAQLTVWSHVFVVVVLAATVATGLLFVTHAARTALEQQRSSAASDGTDATRSDIPERDAEPE
jgi:hypothetical protein